MSDDKEKGSKPNEDDAADAAAEGEEGGHKKGKKKLVFIIAGVALLVIIGGVLALTMGGSKKEEEKAKKAKANMEEVVEKPTYYELPEFLVNLSGTNVNRVSFLKMSVTLELRDKAALPTVEANKPRILDVFNTYLRELRPSDVQGSAGIYRLRDELMLRINSTIEEGLVKDVLFSEIIVQ